MMRTMVVAAVLAAAPMAQAQAQIPEAPAAAAFHKLMAEHWDWYLRTNPQQATSLGHKQYARALGDPSLAAMDAEAREAQAFVARLDAIPVAQLSPTDRVNHAILRLDLANQVERNRHVQRAQLFSNRRGWHLSFARDATDTPLFNKADHEDYLARLAAYPAFNRKAIETTRSLVKAGATHPCAAMTAFERSIATHVVADPTTSDFYAPFRKPRPATISEAEWADLSGRARTLISAQVVPAYREFQQFYASEYQPRCRKDFGDAGMPGGREWYAFKVRLMTTTNRSPDEIHRLGLSEVARIRAEMDEVVKRSAFKGDRRAYAEHLRTDPQYYPKSADELMREASFLAKKIDGEMPKLFGRLPRLPYTVREVPLSIAAGTTTAYYSRGSEASAVPGVYWVNTTKLDQRPLFEMPALTVHEAVPGHHQQRSIQQELDLPAFRQHAASFTAFSEGWGLYSERLGIDMGLYDTPAKDFGRLSYEMWRACRLVVDTGLHSKGWTREQAIDFMMENTALSRANIEAEVHRYMVDSGQALAYKTGELKFRELRTKAEATLGPRFDLRAFHDVVLENGAAPLDVVDAHVNAWIAAEAGKR
jgi:uncharacterized protein (DUF885 family)